MPGDIPVTRMSVDGPESLGYAGPKKDFLCGNRRRNFLRSFHNQQETVNVSLDPGALMLETGVSGVEQRVQVDLYPRQGHGADDAVAVNGLLI